MKIAFIGGGNMASALISGLLRRNVAASDLSVVEIDAKAREQIAARFGVRTFDKPAAALRDFDALVLAVKPQALKSVAESLVPYLSTQLIISIAAAICASDIARWLAGYQKIARAMPNTPASIGMGVTGIAALPGVDTVSRRLAGSVLEAVGEVVWCDDESQLDAVTAISGSGPAYVFYFIEALQKAALQMGLDAALARTLAVSTFTGAAQLAALANEPLSTLRERVTSKGGTTAAALAVFEADQVANAIVRGALAAQQRAKILGKEMGLKN